MSFEHLEAYSDIVYTYITVVGKSAIMVLSMAGGIMLAPLHIITVI